MGIIIRQVMTGTCASSTTSSALAWWFLLLSPRWDDEQIKTWQNDREANWQSLWDAAMFDTSSMCDFEWSPCFLFRRSIWHKAGRGLCISAALCTRGVRGTGVKGAMFETWTDHLWVAGLVVGTTFLVAKWRFPNHGGSPKSSIFSERFSHGNIMK